MLDYISVAAGTGFIFMTMATAGIYGRWEVIKYVPHFVLLTPMLYFVIPLSNAWNAGNVKWGKTRQVSSVASTVADAPPAPGDDLEARNLGLGQIVDADADTTTDTDNNELGPVGWEGQNEAPAGTDTIYGISVLQSAPAADAADGDVVCVYASDPVPLGTEERVKTVPAASAGYSEPITTVSSAGYCVPSPSQYYEVNRNFGSSRATSTDHLLSTRSSNGHIETQAGLTPGQDPFASSLRCNPMYEEEGQFRASSEMAARRDSSSNSNGQDESAGAGQLVVVASSVQGTESVVEV